MILVVDDSELVLKYVRTILEKNGHSVVTAESGAKALGLIDDGLQPDLVLMDLVMPGMDGNDLLEEFLKRGKSLPVVVMSAFIGELREELKPFVKDYISKPHSIESLYEVVERQLKKKEIPDELRQ